MCIFHFRFWCCYTTSSKKCILYICNLSSHHRHASPLKIHFYIWNLVPSSLRQTHLFSYWIKLYRLSIDPFHHDFHNSNCIYLTLFNHCCNVKAFLLLPAFHLPTWGDFQNSRSLPVSFPTSHNFPQNFHLAKCFV